MSKRFKFAPAVLVAAGLAIPVLTQGCSSSSPLCCNEFKVGATINADIGGTAQSQIAVQAVADIAGIGSAALDDITTACRGIAQELDAPKDKQDAAEKETDKQKKLGAWCTLAVSSIGTFKAQAKGTIKLVIEPVKCEVSISAKANCQAKCSGSAQCDLKANPPKCTGGTLSVACKGGCTAEGGVALQCTGKCEGTCKGSCDATGGVAVQCSGKCEGKCSADAQGNGNGVNAQGECGGFCDAKCTANATAPAVSCTGSCSGECSAKCTGSANASVQCNGKCDADFEPLKCEGGKLEGGCKVEAKCEGNCDASVSAKAECTPPKVSLQFSGAADVTAAAKLKVVVEANFGIVAAFKARLDGALKASASLTGNISGVTDIKAACIPPLIAAAGNAVGDLTVSGKATVDLVGSL